jgi:hypothetical protein
MECFILPNISGPDGIQSGWIFVKPNDTNASFFTRAVYPKETEYILNVTFKSIFTKPPSVLVWIIKIFPSLGKESK